MDVDVLLWGGTHKFEAYELEGKFFVNPGSATGALGTGWWEEGDEPVPSFCLMDVSIVLDGSECYRSANWRDRCKVMCLYCMCIN